MFCPIHTIQVAKTALAEPPPCPVIFSTTAGHPAIVIHVQRTKFLPIKMKLHVVNSISHAVT